MNYRCLWAIAGGLVACCAFAQDAKTVDLKGTIHSGTAVIYHGYVVEISGMVQRQTWRADVMSDGSFVVRDLPSGDYILRIMTYLGGEVKQEFLSVHGSPSTVDVTLPKQEPTAPGGPVSLRELQHPPAAKAVRAAAAAQRFSQAGEREKAVEELQKAIRVSPDYAAAHSNLGAEYIRMKDYGAARQEIQQALEIAGPNAVDLSNLAFVDTAERRLPQAVEDVKAALRVDPGNANAHYILGTLLLQDKGTAAEGVRHLEQAAQTVAGAREMLRYVRGAQ
jgi:tetratricopeptide (TPR) repeat protein